MRRELSLSQPLAPWQWAVLPILAVFVGAVAAFLISHPLLLAFAVAGLLYAGFAVLSLRQPLYFVVAFCVTLMILPPFYRVRGGETPIYLSTAILPVGLAVLIARLPDFRFCFDPIAKGLAAFLFGTGLSLPFGFWLSGPEVGTAALLRWLLLAQAAFIYVVARSVPARQETLEQRVFPILVLAAAASAGYGILDFFWPVPLPHPAAEQYIWLGSGLLRRAQGVFYEASSFGNFCGFFLAAVSAAYVARQEAAVGVRRTWLLFLIPVFSLALFVSFSRGSWGNVFVTLLAFFAVSRTLRFVRGLGFLLALALPLVVMWFYMPELWGYLVNARLGSLTQAFGDPNLASSGRFDTWVRVLSILRDFPQYWLFGVGYKTLPYTRLFHNEIITDNGFLSLFLETGILGLAGFVIFSAGVLKTFLPLARRASGAPAFWGAFLFSLWCGELVQMFTIDAYTLWRNMIVFFAVMGLALNRVQRNEVAADRGALLKPNLRSTTLGS